MSESDRKKESSNPDFLGAQKHMKRGISHFKKGEHQRAIDEFELILRHDRSYVRAYNNLGYVYRMAGNYTKALETWKAGLKINPSYRRLHMNISSLQRFLQSKEKKGDRSTIGIEDFERDIGWISENAELLEIREGRFYDTYLIEDDGIRYALKTPRAQILANRKILQGFESACKDWLSLKPNEYLVNARSLELVAGTPFLALDYAAEGSVRDLLDDTSAMGPLDLAQGHSGLPLAQILEFAIQLCIAAYYIHSRLEVAHGDIRPGNLLLSDTFGRSGEQVYKTRPDYYFSKLTNIGQWAVFDRAELFCVPEGVISSGFAGLGLIHSPSGYITPSLPYCAPELIESIRSPNVSTDIYAFGVTLYEMLVGYLPFTGLNPTEVLRQASEKRPAYPSKTNNRIPSLLDDIAMKCLARDPEARFKNFFEIAEVLIEYLARTRHALLDLTELSGRFKRTSQFQFRDEKTDSSVMIVGGTESSSETDQVLEILGREAERERNADVKKRITTIEDVLLVPGSSIGEIYPTISGIQEGLTIIPPEIYRDQLNAFSCHATPGAITNVSLDKSAVATEGDVLAVKMVEKHASLLREGQAEQAAQVLADELTACAGTLLLELPGGHDLAIDFENLARHESFCMWSGPVLEELSLVSLCPSPHTLLAKEKQILPEEMAAISGMLFMLGGKFETALKTFNAIPGELYLPALDIYLWAMAKFQAPEMREIRFNSLKNARSIIKDGILANRDSKLPNTIIMASDLPASLADSFLLRGLVLEQLREYRHAIKHFRECKRIIHTESRLSQKVGVWADLMQGKCMYDFGMPAEAFIRWQRLLARDIDAPFFDFLELGVQRPKALLIDDVLRCCESALSRFTDNAMVLCIKGKLLNSIGRSSDALECLARAVDIEEDCYTAQFIRMEALISEEEYESALNAIRVCVLHEPDEPLFMLREAEILCRLDETEKALEKVKQAIGRGLDLYALRASVGKKRLDELRTFDSFVEIVKDLEAT